MPNRLRLPGGWDVAIGLAVVGLVFLADLWTLADPGLCVDEALYRIQAKSYIWRLRQWGPACVFDRTRTDQLFSHRLDHPPLGRLWLGLVHHMVDPDPEDPLVTHLWGMRLGAALAFAGTATVVYLAALSHAGRVAAVVAPLALVLCPRLFGHAHFATMEMPLCATFVGAVAAASWAFRRPGYARAAVAGLVLGLALLTKMQAMLLPVVIVPWAIIAYARRGRRSRLLAALGLWLAVGLAVFFAGWPWLWYDPIGRLGAYLGTGVHRDPIYVDYFGVKYQDVDVPWHYPVVMLGLTTPVGLLGLALGGACRAILTAGREAARALWLAAAAALLVALAVPGVPVYDGVRLFLPAVVFTALLAGLGAQWLVDWAGRHVPRLGLHVGLALLLATQAYGTVSLHPFQLSYYNALCGGLRGAAHAGMTVTYWGEAVDDELLDHVAALSPAKATIGLSPTLIPAEVLAWYYEARPAFQQKGLKIAEFQPGACELVIVFNRHAYIHWNEPLQRLLATRQALFEHQREGVWLAAVYDARQKRRPDPRPLTPRERPASGR